MRSIVVVASVVSAVSISACKPKDAATDAGGAVAETPVVDAAPAATAEAVDAAPAPTAATATATATAKVAATAKAPELPFVAGETWNGAYNCGPPSQVALHIKKVSGNNVDAIFDFNSRGKHGEFKMAGAFVAPNHLRLNPGDWIVQPPGFVSVGLDGTVEGDAHGYDGQVVAPGCTTFHLRR